MKEKYRFMICEPIFYSKPEDLYYGGFTIKAMIEKRKLFGKFEQVAYIEMNAYYDKELGDRLVVHQNYDADINGFKYKQNRMIGIHQHDTKSSDVFPQYMESLERLVTEWCLSLGKVKKIYNRFI